jgi:hypothetical protein
LTLVYLFHKLVEQFCSADNLLNMKQNLRILCSICILILFWSCSIIKAQSSISASGGDASGTGGSVSYTVGQVAYKVTSGTDGTVSQGVQQPYIITIETAIDDADLDLKYLVYPNPVRDMLVLHSGEVQDNKYSYWLFGANGNLIETKKIPGNETQINMAGNIPGTYYLKITSGTKNIKTFKIIKK